MKKITLLLLLLTFSFGYAQVPTSASPTPPVRNAVDVISIYGGAYTNIAGVNTNPNWGQSTAVTEVAISGDNVLQYANFNYQGTDYAGTQQNISAMEFLHIDIWTNAQAPNVFAISSGGEIAKPISSVAGSWQSLNIPVAGLTGDPTKVIQFKFDGGNGGTIYLDNLYFWKTPSAAGSDATLSDLKIDGTSLVGFSAGTTAYTQELVIGTTTVPQITGATTTDSGATVTTITQATAIPGSATVKVTSQNTSVTKTYTVSFAATLPSSSPKPKNYTTHLALLSDITDTSSFTNFWNPSYYFGANDGTPDLDATAATNKAVKMTFIAGWGGGINTVAAGDVTTDASANDTVHIDYFAPSNVAAGAQGHQFYLDLISRTGNVNTEAFYGVGTTIGGAASTSIDKVIVFDSWQSLDIPLSAFVAKGFNPATFFQFKLGASSDIRTKLAYFDNIFFYKASTLGVKSFNVSNIKMYPNPVSNELTIEAQSTIQKIAVFNLLGQEVLSKSPEANSAKLQTSSLSQGVYVITTTIDNVVSSSKFVKQ
jgi:hypothetical protein